MNPLSLSVPIYQCKKTVNIMCEVASIPSRNSIIEEITVKFHRFHGLVIKLKYISFLTQKIEQIIKFM